MERQQEIQVKSTKFAKKLETKKKTAEKFNMASLTCRHEKKNKKQKGDVFEQYKYNLIWAYEQYCITWSMI